MALFIVLGGVLLAAVGIIILGRVFTVGTVGGRRVPVQKKCATILGKRKEEIMRGTGGMGALMHTRYYITFDLGDGDTIELFADKELFNDSNIGKSGILTFKGSKYIGFIENSEA